MSQALPRSSVRRHNYRDILEQIVCAYESPLIQSYCRVRFAIININILDILTLCLRGKKRILDIGCGFGLFGCYFSTLYPNISYTGIDLNPKRVALANRVAARLGLENARFVCADARSLELDQEFDAIMMIDLLHHLPDQAKLQLLETCNNHLTQDGRLVIKDVTRNPLPKMAFTWVLDVLMTHSFDMWYWSDAQFYLALDKYFAHVETYPILDFLPFPHSVFLGERAS